ncbi:MAG: DUF4301 family protein [Desulfosudis oleivorans]|nr:DUF4301 family protein [Desulfosudis oleivorans]
MASFSSGRGDTAPCSTIWTASTGTSCSSRTSTISSPTGSRTRRSCTRRFSAGIWSGCSGSSSVTCGRCRSAQRGKAQSARAARFATDRLSCALPPGFEGRPLEERRQVLIGQLNRPLRVCGMVKNEGEPGGGPFWVTGKNGGCSLQIVEEVQVDKSRGNQAALWASSTHFNPVDLVCGIRDFRGRKFDLERFVDAEQVFISTKSHEGCDIKALELPGLWNGSMADWHTVFVEVPVETFNPVEDHRRSRCARRICPVTRFKVVKGQRTKEKDRDLLSRSFSLFVPGH